MTTPITDSNIKTAVDLWMSDQTTAEATYGHISDWDISNVTNLTNVLNEKIINYIDSVNMDIISVDYSIDMEWLIKNLKTDTILQGNIDPNKINRG